MRILLLNPNTSDTLTMQIEQLAGPYMLPGTRLMAMNPTVGPRLISSVYDELLSAEPTLELARRELALHDAFIIACYSDHPVIYALRELTTKPVLGIAEASMRMASMIAPTFSIVSTQPRWRQLLWQAVERYGLTAFCSSIRTIGSATVVDRAQSQDRQLDAVMAAARAAVMDDGAAAICLGGAVMTGYKEPLEQALGVPVLDGVSCALLLLQGMHSPAWSRRAPPTGRSLDGLCDIAWP